MLNFLKNYGGTIVVLIALVAIVTLILVKRFKDKKQGKSSCSCGCDNCPMSGKCHEIKDNPTDD